MSNRALHWRLLVTLRDHYSTQIATLDFRDRETIETQAKQFMKNRRLGGKYLYEFVNEYGELLAFREAVYESHEVASLAQVAGDTAGQNTG